MTTQHWRGECRWSSLDWVDVCGLHVRSRSDLSRQPGSWEGVSRWVAREVCVDPSRSDGEVAGGS